MKQFAPWLQLDGYAKIDLPKLRAMGIKVVFLDVDNTLLVPKLAIAEQETKGVLAFLAALQALEFKVVVISNNFTADRRDFFTALGITYIRFALKPFTFGFKKAYQSLGDATIQQSEIIHVGDQFLTDGIGATLYGIRYILLAPIQPKNDLLFALPSRILEKLFGLKHKK